MAIEVGVSSFAALLPDPTTGVTSSAATRLAALVEEIVTADRVGLDVFGSASTTAPTSPMPPPS